MNSIAQVNVPNSTGGVECPSATRAAGPGVTSQVVLTVVSFYFRDHPRFRPAVGVTPDQKFPEQRARMPGRSRLTPFFRLDYLRHVLLFRVTHL